MTRFSEIAAVTLSQVGVVRSIAIDLLRSVLSFLKTYSILFRTRTSLIVGSKPVREGLANGFLIQGPPTVKV
jgi:hypothetical protein